MTTARQRRLDRKYKNHLRCEWCNRWGAIDHETWLEVITALREKHQDYIFFCEREACLRSRDKDLIDKLPEHQKRQLVRL